jgi:hypothetical protein
MEDFTLITLRDDLEYKSNRLYWFESEDQIILSPEKMYLMSLNTREKLPERMHEAMLLWSFDPSASVYCQLYFDWISHCEKMQLYREKMDKRFRFQERFIFASMIVSYIALALTLVLQRFSNG